MNAAALGVSAAAAASGACGARGELLALAGVRPGGGTGEAQRRARRRASSGRRRSTTGSAAAAIQEAAPCGSPPRGAAGRSSHRPSARRSRAPWSIISSGNRNTAHFWSLAHGSLALGSTNAQRWRSENLVFHWHSYFQGKQSSENGKNEYAAR